MSKKKLDVMEEGTTEDITEEVISPEDIPATIIQEAVAMPSTMTQAEVDHGVLIEANKIRTDSARFMAAKAIGHVPV